MTVAEQPVIEVLELEPVIEVLELEPVIEVLELEPVIEVLEMVSSRRRRAVSSRTDPGTGSP